MKMDFNVLHNFISPVTGRIRADDGYVLVGNSDGIAISSPALIDLRLDLIHLRQDYNILSSASIIMGFPNNEAPNAQVLSKLTDGFLYNTGGVVSTNGMLPIGSLPNLTVLHLWLGDLFNRPQEVRQIDITNLPALGRSLNPIYLFKGQIWRGTLSNQAEVSDDLSILEEEVTELQAQLDASDLYFIEQMLPFVPLPFPTVGAQITTAIGAAAAIGTAAGTAAATANSRITSLENIDFIIGHADSHLSNAQVLSNLGNGFLYNTGGVVSVGNISAVVELEGDVTGTGGTGTPIQTTLELTLDEIKIAQDTVNLNNQRIKNLAQSPVEDFDAVSFTFLWDLMHDEVEILWP